jgi:hypothetical protein
MKTNEEFIRDAVHEFAINRVGPVMQAMANAPMLTQVVIGLGAWSISVARSDEDGDLYDWMLADWMGRDTGVDAAEPQDAQATIYAIANAVTDASAPPVHE